MDQTYLSSISTTLLLPWQQSAGLDAVWRVLQWSQANKSFSWKFWEEGKAGSFRVWLEQEQEIFDLHFQSALLVIKVLSF